MDIFKYFLAERWFSKGQKYFNVDDPKLAIDAYKTALGISQSHRGVYLHQAIAFSRLGDYKSAILAVDKEISFNSGNPVYHLFGGILSLESGDANKALEYFETSIRLDNSNVFAKQYKALALLKTNRVSESVMILEQNGIPGDGKFKALFCLIIDEIKDEIENKDFQNIQKLITGLLVKKQNLFDRIMDNFKPHFVDEGKINLKEQYKIAEQLNSLGSYEKSAEICKDALSKNPEHTSFIKLIADNYYNMEDYQNCEKQYKTIMKEIEKDDQDLCRLGVSLYKQNKVEEAKDVLCRAFTLSRLQTRHEIARQLGDIYLTQGERWNAIYYLSVVYRDMENRLFKTKCKEVIDDVKSQMAEDRKMRQ